MGRGGGFRAWSRAEVDSFSINVLETVVKDVAARRFTEYAREHGMAATHSLVFTDNSTAEHVAERGRATTEALEQLNAARREWLLAAGVHQKTDRVASVENDVADALSRDAVEEALRFPRACKLPTLRLGVSHDARDTSHLAPTWR